ncbi:DNA cytosine methyltransferase [Georgenia faecalis]|uniref:DNA cytosine methyltransferase n=1 Tax=Georgenia faecalis TaxID=2483799 RepID=UPI001F49DBAF|nr:DNA cytosine methyltransferase [Georgenia faecalis]
MSFSFVDLFAGIGGFHAALAALGGSCTFASEIDPLAKAVYERNWGTDVAGDIVELTQDRMGVPEHDVLAAGFPCQPFSKSGFQRGMDETRGTLFWNIARVLEERKPSVILLENVRNLAGPRHRDTTWRVIVRTLRDLGYKVSSEPTVFSPHLLPPGLGGRPQVRERVFITGTYVGRERAWAESPDAPLLLNRPIGGWDPQSWDVEHHLPLEDDHDIAGVDRYRLTPSETYWISVWEDLLTEIRAESGNAKLPGFPIWADAFKAVPEIEAATPGWKADFLRKNSAFYRQYRSIIDSWLARHDYLRDVPPSRRKLEWQAQDAASLWDTVMHFRPSGIRAKKPSYLPALVAITQTSIVGQRRRRITPREAARLQGLPDWFDFGAQTDAASYKQMGNGVNVGAAYYLLREHVLRDKDDIAKRAPHVVQSILSAPVSSDVALGGAGGDRVATTGILAPI